MSIVGTNRIVGTLGALAVMAATTGSAHAFVEGRHRQFAEAYGNDNVYGALTFNVDQENSNGTMGLPESNGYAIVPYLESSASQTLTIGVKLFGAYVRPLVGDLSAMTRWRLDASNNDLYERNLGASLTVLGNTVYTAHGHTCDINTRCISNTKSYERDFVNNSATFFVWVIPVTVSARVTGTLSAGVSATATASQVDGERWSLDGVADTSWGASAGLTAVFDACAGLCGFVGVGANGDFRVFEASFTPRAQSKQTSRLNGDAQYSWFNRASMDMTTMAGKLKIYADLVLGRVEYELVNWDGYSNSWKLWGNTGSSTCTDFRGRPYSDCYDVK